ncbi:hypothetical protein EJ08DRAFT_696624 [Tothia fuscella]|uniref:Uncharacterized protein n=1 Tax=Tothia fuscella TaxID=1048955 RepID=A0A9P4NTA1_9PEZI|nr:hypothetical protein EJ08DRAFT_696624 [Tothia fuscella]
MPPKSKEPSEAEIVFNRANVALAKSQRLIASWLPPKTPEELANAKTQEELEKEDADLFTPVPELLGVGAPLPKDAADGVVKRKDTSSLDALRKQLLGRNATTRNLEVKPEQGVSKPLAKTAKPVLSESEDDEGGRSAVFASRKIKSKRPISPEVPTENYEEDLGSDLPPERSPKPSSKPIDSKAKPSKRKASSFLDEMLAEKAKKKSKKKKGVEAAA